MSESAKEWLAVLVGVMAVLLFVALFVATIPFVAFFAHAVWTLLAWGWGWGR